MSGFRSLRSLGLVLSWLGLWSGFVVASTQDATAQHLWTRNWETPFTRDTCFLIYHFPRESDAPAPVRATQLVISQSSRDSDALVYFRVDGSRRRIAWYFDNRDGLAVTEVLVDLNSHRRGRRYMVHHFENVIGFVDGRPFPESVILNALLIEVRQGNTTGTVTFNFQDGQLLARLSLVGLLQSFERYERCVNNL
ncbi:MAG: hypothetical protein KDK12_02155 [Rhodobacteraceae bacterium]|nr:hypothetical protein [Paracoccaceae bacterium]